MFLAAAWKTLSLSFINQHGILLKGRSLIFSKKSPIGATYGGIHQASTWSPCWHLGPK